MGSADLEATAVALTHYDTPAKAKDAFLDAYFGDGRYDHFRSAAHAGLPVDTVTAWMSEPSFFLQVESRLKASEAQKSSLQDSMLDNAGYIMDGNIVDLFDQTPEGRLVVKNIKTLPRHISAAIKQMDIVTTRVPGTGNRVEFTDALRVVMHDKTKVMNIIGDYTDVKNTALKRSDSGAPKMVGMSLVTAMPKGPKDEISHDRAVPHEQEAEGDATGSGDGHGG